MAEYGAEQRAETGAARPGAMAYPDYLAAAWGFKNHWYPALFSDELDEGGLKGTRIAGVPLALRRAKGKVYALKDECIHRGVKLSARPMCLTDKTVTCWYHGFTYDLASGKLATIVAAPDDKLIGKAKIRTYPVEEVNGMIFVFVGDEEAVPPPLAHDLPHRVPDDYEHRVAYPLDPDTMMLGMRRTCVGNWRLATESGGDPGHVLIHRHAKLVLAKDYLFALGEKPAGTRSIRLHEDGPSKGITKFITSEMDLVFENKDLDIKARGHNVTPGLQVSLYMPGVLMVENWPEYKMVQYEWYVPIDAGHHEYWQVIAVTCRNDEEREDFRIKFDHMLRDLALKDFNDDDVFARDAQEAFYASGPGWEDEKLCMFDSFIVGWRRLAEKYHRGIQDPPRRGKYATS